jgi:hypothetical protein
VRRPERVPRAWWSSRMVTRWRPVALWFPSLKGDQVARRWGRRAVLCLAEGQDIGSIICSPSRRSYGHAFDLVDVVASNGARVKVGI